MTNKFLLVKILGITMLIFIAFLYFALYFLPTLKSINRIKREVRDTNVRINDFVKMENRFTFSTEKERGYLREKDETLLERFPQIEDRQGFIQLFTTLSDYIQNKAKADGIFSLVITSNSEDLAVNANTLSSDKKSLKQLMGFATSRLHDLQRQMQSTKKESEKVVDTAPYGTLSSFVEQLKHQVIYLSFSGDIQSAVNFINHIPWYQHYIGLDRVIVSEGEYSPLFLVSLKMYYIDLQKKNE